MAFNDIDSDVVSEGSSRSLPSVVLTRNLANAQEGRLTRLPGGSISFVEGQEPIVASSRAVAIPILVRLAPGSKRGKLLVFGECFDANMFAGVSTQRGPRLENYERPLVVNEGDTSIELDVDLQGLPYETATTIWLMMNSDIDEESAKTITFPVGTEAFPAPGRLDLGAGAVTLLEDERYTVRWSANGAPGETPQDNYPSWLDIIQWDTSLVSPSYYIIYPPELGTRPDWVGANDFKADIFNMGRFKITGIRFEVTELEDITDAKTALYSAQPGSYIALSAPYRLARQNHAESGRVYHMGGSPTPDEDANGSIINRLHRIAPYTGQDIYDLDAAYDPLTTYTIIIDGTPYDSALGYADKAALMKGLRDIINADTDVTEIVQATFTPDILRLRFINPDYAPTITITESGGAGSATLTEAWETIAEANLGRYTQDQTSFGDIDTPTQTVVRSGIDCSFLVVLSNANNGAVENFAFDVRVRIQNPDGTGVYTENLGTYYTQGRTVPNAGGTDNVGWLLGRQAEYVAPGHHNMRGLWPLDFLNAGQGWAGLRMITTQFVDDEINEEHRLVEVQLRGRHNSIEGSSVDNRTGLRLFHVPACVMQTRRGVI